jgi:hypothetical protein
MKMFQGRAVALEALAEFLLKRDNNIPNLNYGNTNHSNNRRLCGFGGANNRCDYKLV